MNYTEELYIDETALDVEWLKQSEKFMRVSRLSAKVDAEVRRLEEKMKVLRSELILEVNGNPKLLGKGLKPTGQTMEAYFRTHKKHKEIKEQLNEAQYRADVLRSAVFAFQNRKTALENLVTLHGQQYFSTPNVPHDLSKERQKNYQSDMLKHRIAKGDK